MALELLDRTAGPAGGLLARPRVAAAGMAFLSSPATIFSQLHQVPAHLLLHNRMPSCGHTQSRRKRRGI